MTDPYTGRGASSTVQRDRSECTEGGVPSATQIRHVHLVAKRSEPERAPEDLARGKRVREAYKAAGFTRKEFAEELDRYYHDVERLEKGQKPDLDTLTRIAELCGVTERWLVRGPVYTPEFSAWLEQEAPPNLLDVERELLASINFPEPHPGAGWYANALSAWRLGTKGALLEHTHVRRKATSAG